MFELHHALFSAILTLYHTIPTFNNPEEEGFGKHCWKRRKCWLPAFSPFPTVFSALSKREIVTLATFDLSSANALNLVMSKILSFVKGLNCLHFSVNTFNSFPNKPCFFFVFFLCVCSTSLLKTLWEKEKLLVTSNFSFSHSVFYSFGELSAIFIDFEIVVCKLFKFGGV